MELVPPSASPALRALSLLAFGWRREERLLSGGDVRPARTLVGALAHRTIDWPEAAFGLGQVLITDLLASLVVVAPSDEVRPVAVLNVMAVGLDDLRWCRLPILAGNRPVDLFQEPCGIEWPKRSLAGVEQVRQRLVVIPEVRVNTIVRWHLEQQRHVRMSDGCQHKLVVLHVDQKQAALLRSRHRKVPER